MIKAFLILFAIIVGLCILGVFAVAIVVLNRANRVDAKKNNTYPQAGPRTGKNYNHLNK